MCVNEDKKVHSCVRTSYISVKTGSYAVGLRSRCSTQKLYHYTLPTPAPASLSVPRFKDRSQTRSGRAHYPAHNCPPWQHKPCRYNQLMNRRSLKVKIVSRQSISPQGLFLVNRKIPLTSTSLLKPRRQLVARERLEWCSRRRCTCSRWRRSSLLGLGGLRDPREQRL
jgi:hypothetical protein